MTIFHHSVVTAIIGKVVAAKVEVSTTDPAGSTSLSRRQSTSAPVTCETVLSVDLAEVTSLTGVGDMEVAEVKQCVTTLGSVQWAEDVRDSLWSTLWDDWTTATDPPVPNELAEVGTIMLSLDTSTDAQSVQIAQWISKSVGTTATAIMEQLGTVSGWSDAQLTKLGDVANEYVTKDGGTWEGADSATLATLGHLLCGVSQDNLNKVTDDNFKNGVEGVTFAECPPEGLQRLAARSKTAYGDIDTWPVQLLGLIPAGLSADDVHQLTVDQVSSLSVQQARAFPCATVTALSDDHLTNLTLEVADLLTAACPDLELPTGDGSQTPADSGTGGGGGSGSGEGSGGATTTSGESGDGGGGTTVTSGESGDGEDGSSSTPSGADRSAPLIIVWTPLVGILLLRGY